MGVTKGLCELLKIVITPAIFMIAVIELVLMIACILMLARFKQRIKRLNDKEVVKTGRSRKEAKGQVAKTIEMESRKNWDEFDQFLADYQEKNSWYSAFSLIVQIFTLLGILGTVAGLYLAMSNRQDMYQGVELALSTTIIGILFAIIYKLADIVISSVYINYIEDGINRYEKIYKVDSEDAAIVAVLEQEEPMEDVVEDKEAGESK